jgi:hypothetical protein
MTAFAHCHIPGLKQRWTHSTPPIAGFRLQYACLQLLNDAMVHLAEDAGSNEVPCKDNFAYSVHTEAQAKRKQCTGQRWAGGWLDGLTGSPVLQGEGVGMRDSVTTRIEGSTVMRQVKTFDT